MGHKVSKQPRQLVEIKMLALPTVVEIGFLRRCGGAKAMIPIMSVTEMLPQRNQPDFYPFELTGSYRSIVEAARGQ